MTGDRSDAITAHRETVRAWARTGGPLHPDGPHTTVANPDWFRVDEAGTLQPRTARRALHRRLLDEYRDRFPDARAERRAIVLAGPPGAGKSTVLEEVLGADRTGWLVVDADEFKRALLTEAIRDGSYDRSILPPEIRAAEAAGERFYPLELASLVHDESSQLATRLRNDAIRDGMNIVIDTVLSSPEKAVALGQRLAGAGYAVEVIDVEVPFPVSEARIAARWEESYQRALDGADELGGRWVPSEYARGVYTGPDGRSLPEISADRLAATCPTVTRIRRYVTPAEGAPRTLQLDQSRTAAGAPLIDTRLARARTTVAQSMPPRPQARTSERDDRGR